MAISLFTACNNDKTGKDKYDRDTKTNDTRDKDENDDKNKEKMDNKDENTDIDKSTSSWSTSDETRFMDDCQGTAKQNVGVARAKEYCDCMLQKIKKMYSNYTEADRKLGGSSQTEINDLAADCNRQ